MIKPTAVIPLENYRLLLDFSNGEKKLFDLTPYLPIPFYAKLRNVAEFKKVYVGEYTIEWPNGCDISPHELYDDSVPVE